jgi:thiaminase (transcriptional activator TenA)
VLALHGASIVRRVAGFTDELRAVADPVWRAQHEHPFVRGLGDGTLDEDRFRHYVRQDYLYLIDYARLLALGTARAPRLEDMTRLAELARETLATEMELHRGFAARWGVSAAELERERPTPTTRAYVDFLLRTAALGDFAVLVAALLPCMWGYEEVALRLSDDGGDAGRYAEWIAMYAGEEFRALAGWCRELTDRVAAEAAGAARDRMAAAFVESSRHELAFWDASWRLEEPVAAAAPGAHRRAD